MHTPSRKLSDSLVTHGTESALKIPEIAEHTAAAERFQDLGSFSLREIGFPSRIVRVSFALDLYMPFDACTTGTLQPDLEWLPIAVIGFSEEAPVETSMPLKISIFEPAWRFSWVFSPNPSPQFMEDDMIHMFERATARHVPMIVS